VSPTIVKAIELSLAQIGNSRGIRLPSDLIRTHGLDHGLILEDCDHELAIQPKGGPKKLSRGETAREMAASGEDWSEWETTPSVSTRSRRSAFDARLRAEHAHRFLEPRRLDGIHHVHLTFWR